ncbi:MAG: GNAT family N-acetyltransferase [Asgard group archaeon]|nr:GNAT family N-acetyltransferase [Asgard group archaeon]
MIKLETERLIIRNFTIEDWKDIATIAMHYEETELAKYDEGPWPNTLEEYRKIADWFAKGDDFVAVVLKAEKKMIGWIAKARNRKKEKEFNFGYIFHLDFHGKGYATESCLAVIKYIFEELDAELIVSGTAKINEPSNKLLKRLGFTPIGETTQAFRKDEEGKPIEFVGVDYVLRK